MNAPAAPVLELRSLSIAYGDFAVVSDVSFSVGEGEFVTLLGPSGSGKTSILRVIAGFVRPSHGEVLLRGEYMNDVAPYQRDIGMVFQNYALFPHMTVAENLRFGLRMAQVLRSAIETRVDEALSYVRLGEFRSRYPHELSGGQQQRVAIARAIVMQPSILLLDEPMSNLDARLRADMRYELLELLDRTGITAVSVTHNQEEALAMSDRVVIIADGRIRQVGTPTEIYTAPADLFVADFIGDANVIACRPVGEEDGLTRLEPPWGGAIYCHPRDLPAGKHVTLLIRPELIDIVHGGGGSRVNRLEGRLAHIAYMGAYFELRVAVAGHELRVKKPASAAPEPLVAGECITLQWDPAAMVHLAATGNEHANR